MFDPHYTITPKLLANIKKITVLIEKLNSEVYPTVVLAELKRNAFSLSSYSSTSIEGNPLPLSEVKIILKNNPKIIRDSEREVINYNNALKELDMVVRERKGTLNLATILNTQKIVTNKLIGPENSGKLRTTQVYVKNPKLRKIIYMAPQAQDIRHLLDDLIQFVNSSKDIIDPLILAGIFHKQFVIVHPFTDGNGRTARLITKLVLASMGLNTFSLFSFENYYNQHIEKYFNTVGVVGHYYDEKDTIDFTPWLEYFTDGIIDELLRVRAILKKQKKSSETVLKPHHETILYHITKHGFITDREYARITSRAKPTRHLDFKKLINLGLIQKKGNGRATIYIVR
ncbi:MAG: Fic family protein [Patescibacteria group bacterium]